jgi:hypothetical protein
MTISPPKRVLALIPPMTQLNTPYPSTAYLTGFLRSRGVPAVQEDLALALVLALFSRPGLARVREAARALPPARQTAQVRHFEAAYARYADSVEPVIAFLQGRDPMLAHRIVTRAFLPEGARFATLDVYVNDDGSDDGGDPLAWAFGALGLQDRARHLATLFLNDLADVLRDAVDPRFEFVRYAEKLATSQPTFDPLAQALEAPPNLVDETLRELTIAALERHRPQVLLLSVPFPGAVYAALRIAQAVKAHAPDVTIVLGGGFVNTELRELREPRLFDFVDFVTLDAGERPLLALLEHLEGRRSRQRLVRCFVREHGVVRYLNFVEPDIPFDEVGTPTWDGLPLAKYLSLLDMLNPMNRLWSDGRWNKLTVAHGCYWKKCSFCDVSLDYISRYDAASATTLVDRIEAVVAETGQTGFHFVDEAAPPKALKALAAELQRRGTVVSWWGNVRFEKTFTPALCRALADSGCVAISGGLEVASDRLLRRRRHPGACLPDVRLPDADRAGHGRRAGVRAPAVRPRLHPQRLLPPLRLHRALAGGPRAAGLRRHAAAAARQPVREERRRLRRPHRHRPRRDGHGAEEGDLQLHARHRPGGGRAQLVRRARAPADRGPAAHREGAGGGLTQAPSGCCSRRSTKRRRSSRCAAVPPATSDSAIR